MSRRKKLKRHELKGEMWRTEAGLVKERKAETESPEWGCIVEKTRSSWTITLGGSKERCCVNVRDGPIGFKAAQTSTPGKYAAFCTTWHLLKLIAGETAQREQDIFYCLPCTWKESNKSLFYSSTFFFDKLVMSHAFCLCNLLSCDLSVVRIC